MILLGTASADVTPEAAKDLSKAVITGRIMMKDGSSPAGGQVMFYDSTAGPPPIPDQYERIPDIEAVIAGDGTFAANLLPGAYYLSVIKRKSGERIGPPVEGDYVYRDLDEKGNPKKYAVKAGEKIDLGILTDVTPLKAESISRHVSATAIEGTVTDAGGKPVPGVVVIAFYSPVLRSKPIFVSGRTGTDGRYTLRVAVGTYYLRARNTFGAGPPEAGQIVGYYGGDGPAPVSVKAGEIRKGIDIGVILFPGRGPSFGIVPPKM